MRYVSPRSIPKASWALPLAITWGLGLIGACSAGDTKESSPCVQIDPDCAPLYQPTFDEVFARTLEPTCGAGGSSCHSQQGAQGGLAFAEPDESHAQLLGLTGSRPRVLVDDPGCSLLLRRLETTGSTQMPPGAPLPAAERCSIALWINAGAER